MARSAPVPAKSRRDWKEAAGGSILAPLGYILVLFAMRLAPVAQVAPARELSIVIGAWSGARMPREGDAGPRLVAAAPIVVGVVALALG